MDNMELVLNNNASTETGRNVPVLELLVEENNKRMESGEENSRKANNNGVIEINSEDEVDQPAEPTTVPFIKLRDIKDITMASNPESTATSSQEIQPVEVQSTMAVVQKYIMDNMLAKTTSKKPPMTCITVIVRDKELRNCKSCNSFGLLQYCCYLIDEEFYLCNLNCLRNHFRKMPITQSKYCQPQVEASVCSFCRTLPRFYEKMLAWQTLHFCSESCMKAYQKFYVAIGCTRCKKPIEIMSDNTLVRFGREVEGFCSATCRVESSRRCRFCHEKLPNMSSEFCSGFCQAKFTKSILQNNIMGVCSSCNRRLKIYFAVNIDGMEGYFCNNHCFDHWIKYYQESVHKCVNCNVYHKSALIELFKLMIDGKLYNLCSIGCQNMYIDKLIKFTYCVWCFRRNYNIKMIVKYVANSVMYLCSFNCLREFMESACSTCSQKTSTYFHLELDTKTALHFCMNKCLYNFLNYHLGSKQAEQPKDAIPFAPLKEIRVPLMIRIPSNNKNQGAQCPNSNGEPAAKTILITKDGVPSKPEQLRLILPKFVEKKAVGTMCQVVSADMAVNTQRRTFQEQGSQTGILVPDRVPFPIPLPLYVPIPTETPKNGKPFPLPVPIPVFIPTLKNSSESIIKEVSTATTNIPINPIEAEMVKLAELVAKEANKEMPSAQPGTEIETTSEFLVDHSQCTHDIQTLPRLPSNQFNFYFGVEALTRWMQMESQLETQNRKRKLLKNFLQMNHLELNKTLTSFVQNFKRPYGKDFAPDTMYYFCLGINNYLNQNNKKIDIFHDVFYKEFAEALNNVVQKFRSLQGEAIITRIEEKFLWENNQLGISSPMVLLQTMIFFNTKYLNLHTAEDHLTLSFQNILKYLIKTNDPQVYEVVLRHFPNKTNNVQKNYYIIKKNADKTKCPIQIHEFYLSKCSEEAKTKQVYYLEPEKHVSADSPVWFTSKEMAKEDIQKMVNVCELVKEVNLTRLAFTR